MLTITHTHEAGTMILGTSKGDGTNAILKALRWRWGSSIGAWHIPMSRDRRPKHSVIRATVTALEEAGHEVIKEIDESVRSTADVEAGKILRQTERTEALITKADRKASDANTAWERHELDVSRLPEGGEPIKVGHHSERRHRAALTKADNSGRRGIEAHDIAERAAARAEAATYTTEGRYSVETVANRIHKLEAMIRRTERRLTNDAYDMETGYRPPTDQEKERRAERLAPGLGELRDTLGYWQGVRAGQIAEGVTTEHSPATIDKGDAVKIREHWHTVVRVNAKTVSVATAYSWTDRVAYAAIQDHRTAAQLAAQAHVPQ